MTRFGLLNFQVFLAEIEEKNEPVAVSCAQLKREKAELMSEVTTLQGSVEKLKKELFKTGLENNGLVMVSKTIVVSSSFFQVFKNDEPLWCIIDGTKKKSSFNVFFTLALGV